MLPSLSTLYVVVRFDMGESQMRAIIEAIQPLALKFCGEDTDHGGTPFFLLGGG